MESLIAVYFDETFEQLNTCEASLSALRKGYSKEEMNQFFRSMHSIKGASAAMGYEEIQDLAHKLEDVWDAVRMEKIKLTESIIDLSYESVDIIYQMAEHRKNPPEETDAISTLIGGSRNLKQQLIQALEKKEPEEAPVFHQIEEAVAPEPQIDPPRYQNRYYVHLTMDEENPMPAVTRFLVHKNLIEKGVIDYLDPPKAGIVAMESIEESNEMEILFQSHLDRLEVQREIDVGYIKDFFVLDLTEAYKGHALTISDKNFFLHFFEEMAKILQEIEGKKPETLDPLFWKKTAFNLIRIHSQAVLLEDHPHYRSWKEELTMLKEILQAEDIPILRNSETAFKLIQQMMVQLLYDAYRMTANETFLRRYIVKEDQNIIVTFQNAGMELDAHRYKLYLMDISALTQLRQDEVNTLNRVDQQLQDKGVTLFLIHDGTIRKRIHTGGTYMPITRKILFYENERDMIHKVIRGWVMEQNKDEEAEDEDINC